MGRKANYILLVILVVGFAAYNFFGGNTKTVLDFGDDGLAVNYNEFETVLSYSKIEAIELAEVSDFGIAIEGGSNTKYRWGKWENERWGIYSQCTTTNTDYCVVLTLNDGELFILSYQDERTTIDLSEMIHGYLSSHGYDVEWTE